MDSIEGVLALLQRELELGEYIRQPGGLRAQEEEELHALQARLSGCLAEVALLRDLSAALHRPLRELSVADVRAAMASRA